MGNLQLRSFRCLVTFLLISTSPAAAAQIRLSGSTRCSGRVEIYHDSSWGSVCDDSWDLNDAQVVCRQLGCGASLEAPGSAKFGEATGQIWLDDVNCSGSERSVTECEHRGFGTNDCTHSEDASVVCSGVPIRLSGSTLCSGRVEIYYNNSWGTVCDDEWDSADAKVACRELGCGTASQWATFGEGTGSIWLDDVGCSGSERSITKCEHRGFGQNNCGHHEDIGVICSAILPKPSISMNLATEVPWGQNVRITCSVSTQTQQILNTTFTLTKASSSFRETQMSSTNAATFNLPKVKFDNEGSYQCQYNTTVSSGDLSSPLSNSVSFSVTVSHPKPSIYMNPADEVTWGQNIGITCMISTEILGGTFILQKTSGSFRKEQASSTKSATFNILKVDFNDAGSYQCHYRTRVSSRTFSSPLSDPVSFFVTVSHQKPSIYMNPADEVTWGQKVGITCMISTEILGGRFILQKTSGSFRKEQASSTKSATFNILKVDFDNAGSYQCQYQTRVSSRTFSSPLSDPVSLSVAVPLQHPSIFLTSPNGGLVWGPGSAEVTRGNSFAFICSISSHYPGGVFSLIFSGSSLTNTKPAVNRSASFDFPVAEYEHLGNYSCVYEVTLSSRTFASAQTAPISVIIKMNWLPLVSSVAAVGLLLILLVLVVVCLVKRRQAAKQPGALVETQLAVRVGNDYSTDEDAYANVNLVNNKEKAGRVEEEDNEDYVEPGSDEDHDYEEAESANFRNVKEACSSVEQSTEGEETSDDEDDYENVTQPSDELTLEIYGENENIYQN